ncbi:DUF1980 domain-containing protein [Paenibacillus lupini]|uniref:DUF1980 domain-containing protein n=1 Tax=Paenibacillus lupini TaxID=1450204 RepID=UPI00141F8E6E|nr:uncharacterized membrane protein YcgQ (UPF0703/DUF1980 family) [Paenibacillus lupini]
MNHNWIRAGFLSAFAFLIIYLDRLGQLSLYLAPRMELYVKLSAIVLNAAAVHQAFLALRLKAHSDDCTECSHDHSHHHDHHYHDHDHDHDHSMSPLKSILVYGLFLLPLLLGFLLPAAAHDHEVNSGIPHLHSGQIPKAEK